MITQGFTDNSIVTRGMSGVLFGQLFLSLSSYLVNVLGVDSDMTSALTKSSPAVTELIITSTMTHNN